MKADQLDYDVIIVGSGVAGAILADSLATHKHRILILEAGPKNDPRSEIIKRYRLDPRQKNGSPHKWNAQTPRQDSKHKYYVQKGPVPFKSQYERCVGGTTWHWLGTCLRMLPVDFQMQSVYGVGMDWPISYEDLEPWYTLAEKELGVAGDDREDLGSPRSGPYPKRSIPLSYFDREVIKFLEHEKYEGKRLHVNANPQARDPDLCQGSRSCIPICPMGAKYEADQHLTRAKKKGVKLKSERVVSKVLIGNNGKVKALQYRTLDGSTGEVRAKVYVLAANAIETPKLLLMSENEASPQGASNSSGHVGRNLMDHPLISTIGFSKQPVFAMRGPLCTAGIDSLRDSPQRSKQAAFRLEIVNSGWDDPIKAAEQLIDQNIFGKDLQQALKSRAHCQIEFAALMEQLPDFSNRVTLAKTDLDPLGFPRPEIHYSWSEYLEKGIAEAKRAHQFLFAGLKGRKVGHRDFGAGHIMGTCRMGDQSKNSVVNKHLRSHDHENLFIVGSAVFPTGGTSNPSLTIAALSLRAAAYIHKELVG